MTPNIDSNNKINPKSPRKYYNNESKTIQITQILKDKLNFYINIASNITNPNNWSNKFVFNFKHKSLIISNEYSGNEWNGLEFINTIYN